MGSPLKKSDPGVLEALDPQLVSEVSGLIQKKAGIQLGERQKTMVESRLRKRMLELGIPDSARYLAHLRANLATESEKLVSLLTTHHTAFFREFSHFEYLEKNLPMLIESVRKRGEKKLRIWSAACSKGQEVYSLSMFLQAHLPRLAPDFTYELLGSDIDPESVKHAKNGVYHHQELKEAPLTLVSGHWIKGTKQVADFVKAKPSIKDPCRFEVANLFSLSPELQSLRFDAIFCRNVFIYFTHDQIKTITQQLLKQLTREGLLFIGVSETLSGLSLPVTSVAPSVYRHPEAVPTPAKASKGAQSTAAAPGAPQAVPQAAKPIRVLCVDDSPSIHTILKQILSEVEGFQIVGSAMNGLQASEKLKSLSPDVVTLDIHMPEQTGIEYLKKNFGPSHPPVVMVTSVSREDSDLALEALRAGAADYVEKPALANMREKGEELRNKLRCALHARQLGAGRSDLSLDESFSKGKGVTSQYDPGESAVLLVAALSDRKRLKPLLKEKAPVIVLMKGAGEALSKVSRELALDWGVDVKVLSDSAQKLESGQVYVVDLKGSESFLPGVLGDRSCSVELVGGVDGGAEQTLKALGDKLRKTQWIREEPSVALRSVSSWLELRARESVPLTSFTYLRERFFSGGA